jgi:long-chain acyl-CoA synthetase
LKSLKVWAILTAVPSSVLGDRFRCVCRDRAGSTAVHTIETGSNTTFEDLENAADLIRAALRDLGVVRGAAVVSFVGNHPICFSTIVACLEAGVALVPLGEATAAEAAILVEQARAAAVITNRELPLAFVGQSALTADVSMYRLADRLTEPPYPPSVVLKLTSGSTDLPKAAVASEANLVNDGRHIVEAMGIVPEDINYACIPLSHSYGIGNVVMPLLWQGSRVVLRQSFSPSRLLADVSTTKATVFPGVPFMFERVESAGGIERLPSCLRLLITAGAPIDARTVSWCRARLDRKVHSFYGSSETGGIAYDESDDVSEPLNVGRAMPETSISIRQSADSAHSGRIFVTGNAVASGYANADQDDARPAFFDGGFLTGDIGYVNDMGRLVLEGRVSRLINISGRKVDPAEVQRRLIQVPGIADARVLGIADGMRGEELVAFLIRTDAELTPIAIRQRCAETLSTHKIPRQFIFVDRFPVNARGKIDWPTLERLAVESHR